MSTPLQTAAGTIIEVEAVQRNTQDGPAWLYTASVQFDGEEKPRKLKTWKEEPAQQAFKLKGQRGTVSYSIKPSRDPQYPADLMLSGVEPLDGASVVPSQADLPPGLQAQPSTPAPAFSPAAAAPAQPAAPSAPPAGMTIVDDEARQTRIRRGGVAKAAATLFASGVELPHTNPGSFEHYVALFKLVDELVETGESVPF